MSLVQLFWKNQKAGVPIPEFKQDGPNRVIFLPGNGVDDIYEDLWYSWVARKLKEKIPTMQVVTEDMPDPLGAKEVIWKTFILRELQLSAQDIVVGHSSGAECGMRLAEDHKLRGLVLVSACHTDLGSSSERKAGYYNRPWKWTNIKKNCSQIVQFGSKDDPFVDFAQEQQFVANQLSSDFRVFSDRGHFNAENTFPELLQALVDIHQLE
jgi:predicted alpha/beta hydrolase family esterase